MSPRRRALINGEYVDVVSVEGVVDVVEGAPVAANILNGYLEFTASAAATTLITVPAGRTWQGTIAASCSTRVDAASATPGRAQAVFSVAGAGATPPAGNVFAVEAKAAANAATGVVGNVGNNYGSIPLTVVAPSGNTVTVQVTTTHTGAVASGIHVAASGHLV